jgi:hypothetical protein
MLIGAEVGANSKIVNSQVDSATVLGKNSTIINSRIVIGYQSMRKAIRIGNNTRISNSTILLGAKGVMTREQAWQDRHGDGRMFDRYLHSREDATIGNNVAIQNSDVYYHFLAAWAQLGDGTRVTNSKIANTSSLKATTIVNSRLFQDLDYTSLNFDNMIQIKLDERSQVQNVQLNRGNGEGGYYQVAVGKNARLSNIGKTDLKKKAPVALQVGSLLLGAATMGLGAVALGFALQDTGNLFILDGAKLDGRGRPACGRGQAVEYGTRGNGEKVANFSDLQQLCGN